MGRSNKGSTARKKTRRERCQHAAARETDLKHIARRRARILAEQAALQKGWNEKQTVFSGRVDDLMRGAGIHGAVKKVQVEQQKELLVTNTELQRLGTELQELTVAEKFLQGRNQLDRPPPKKAKKTPPGEATSQDNGNKPLAEPTVEPKQEVEPTDLHEEPGASEE